MTLPPRHRPAETLVEVIVALGMLVLIVTGFMRLSVSSYDGVRRGSDQTIAASYAQQGLEAARSIADQNFSSLVDGPHGISDATGKYAFSGTADTLGTFQRVVTVASVQRDTNDAPVVSGGTVDPLSKSVTSAVTWTGQAGGQQTVSFVTTITEWALTRWILTTLADFGTGTRNSTVTASVGDGAVQLKTMSNFGSMALFLTMDPGGSGRANDVQVDTVGDRLIVATGLNPSTGEVLSYDLSSISAGTMTLLGSTELSATGTSLAVAGDYAYIADTTNQIRVVRLSDMTLVTSWTLPGATVINDVVYNAATNQLFVGRSYNVSNSEFLILSLASPTTLSITSQLSFTYGIRRLSVNGNTAYLITDSTTAELQPVTLSPLAAATACDLTGTQLPNDVVSSGTRLFVTRDNGATSNFIEFAINPSAPTDCTYITGHVSTQTTFGGNATMIIPDIPHSTVFVLTNGSQDYAVDLSTYVYSSFTTSGIGCRAGAFLGAYLYLGCDTAPSRIQVLQGGGAVTQELVCTDGLQNGWTISNVSNTTNTADTFLVRSGTQSLELNPAANGSTQFNKSFSTTAAQALNFYVNSVSPWAFGLYSGNAGTPGTAVTITNSTYGAVYEKNTEEGAFTDFPTANFAAMKAQAQSTSSYINGGAANYTLTAGQLTGYAGKMIYVEFTNAARTLTVNLGGGGGTYNVSIVTTGGAGIIFTNYNSATITSASTLWPVAASPMPISFTQAGNRRITLNGLIFTNQQVDITKHTGNLNVVVNGSIVAGIIDSRLVKTTLTYTTDFNTNPPSATFFTPNYYGQNLSVQASAGNAVLLDTYLSGGIDKSPTTWQQVTIPIAAFGAIGSPISYFKIFDQTGNDQATIFIDDLQWLLSGGGGGSLLSAFGTFTSPAQSLGSATAWKYLRGTVSGTGVGSFRIRTASTQGGLTSARFVGPDGTSATSYSSGSLQTITTDPSASGTQWIQAKAYLTGDAIVTPSLEHLMILSQ